ncbi:MAG: hypothetical protein JWQ53_1573, partial [Klenkia sp.]|nr:hypothetical protein [Klenkia sp.]
TLISVTVPASWLRVDKRMVFSSDHGVVDGDGMAR